MSVSELMRLMQAYNIPLPPSTYSTVQQGEMAAAIMDSGKVSYPASVGEAEVLAACAVPAAYDGDDGDELVRQVRARTWPMLPADDPARLWVWFANCTAVTPVACAVFYVMYKKEAQHAKHKEPLPGEKLTRCVARARACVREIELMHAVAHGWGEGSAAHVPSRHTPFLYTPDTFRSRRRPSRPRRRTCWRV